MIRFVKIWLCTVGVIVGLIALLFVVVGGLHLLTEAIGIVPAMAIYIAGVATVFTISSYRN